MKFLNRYFFSGIGAGILIVVLVLVAAGYMYVRSFTQGGMLEDVLEPPPFPEDLLADYDWSVQTLAGAEIHMTDLKGKVIFLNFWATWCPPCIAEMPSIERLYSQVKDLGIVFVCVSHEESQTVGRFVKEKEFTLPVYTMQEKPPSVFASAGLPTTYIISADGKIAFRHLGPAKWDDDKAVAFLKELVR